MSLGHAQAGARAVRDVRAADAPATIASCTEYARGQTCAKAHSNAASVYTAQLSEMESQQTALCGKLPVVVKNTWRITYIMQ